MRRFRFWPDRLGGQIALLLFSALLLEFVGSELLFRRIESGLIARERASQLAQQIIIADRLLIETPVTARAGIARRLWQQPLAMDWQADAPVLAGSWNAGLAKIGDRLRGAQPDLVGREVRLSANRQSLTGAWQLSDGSWVVFRAAGYLDLLKPLHGHIGMLMMLVICVGLLALILARLMGRPLRALADAADGASWEEATPVAVEGPREVRHVAAAFNAMQARLADQVNERIQALAAVSHDLRTPIARLRLRAAVLRDPKNRAAIGHDLDEMESFIRSLLDFLRGGDPEEERLVDLASLVITIVHDAQDVGGKAHYDGPASLELVTRPLKLQRAIANLVQNALSHAGEAHVRLCREGDNVRLVVEDRGPGIPSDQLNAVFEPFRRVEGSRNRDTGGAGLGLAIVRRSISRLGGSIQLENRRGGGLRATIIL